MSKRNWLKEIVIVSQFLKLVKDYMITNTMEKMKKTRMVVKNLMTMMMMKGIQTRMNQKEREGYELDKKSMLRCPREEKRNLK